MDEDLLDIKRRAGISTNWNPDTVSRAITRMENSIKTILEQIDGIEGADKQRELLIQYGDKTAQYINGIKAIISKLR